MAGGSILLIHRGEIVLKEGFGCADIETNTPFLADTPVLVDELTKPLGMKRTFYRDETALAKIGEMPTRYYHGKNGQLLVTKKRRLAQKNTYSSSGGSVISTAPDLARWLMTIRNGGRHEGTSYLSPEMFARMISSHPRSRCLHSSMCVLSRSLHPR